jgi:hypothetical protein
VNREGSDLRIGRWWSAAMVLVTVEALVLLGWWLSQAVNREDLGATFTPFSTFNVGTVLVQWGVVLMALLLLNPVLARRFVGDGATEPGDGETSEGRA